MTPSGPIVSRTMPSGSVAAREQPLGAGHSLVQRVDDGLRFRAAAFGDDGRKERAVLREELEAEPDERARRRHGDRQQEDHQLPGHVAPDRFATHGRGPRYSNTAASEG